MVDPDNCWIGGEPLAVLALGARTPVGMTAATTAAAVRAGISRLREHEYMVDMRGDPYRMASIPSLGTLRREERLVELALGVILELLGSAAGASCAHLETMLILVLPEVRAGDTWSVERVRARFQSRLASFWGAHVVGIAGGHAGAAAAVYSARQWLLDTPTGICIVIGVDTYIDPELLERLDKEGRLMSPASPWGFIPGEGAGGLLLARTRTAKTLRVDVLAHILAAVTTHEPATFGTETPCVGRGLGAAITGAVSALEMRGRIAQTYTDLNNERYRSREYTYAVLRAPSEAFEEIERYVSAADCWGDVGSATLTLHAILAVTAGVRGYSPGPYSLLLAGSESGARGALTIGPP